VGAAGRPSAQSLRSAMSLLPLWWIDTDAGIDDAQALFVLLRAQELGQLAIAGISCSHGNVALSKVIGNVCAVLRAFGSPQASSIPVYVGASAPLCARSTSAADWHGEDGLGLTGAGAAAPLAQVAAGGEPGAAALLRAARAAAAGGGAKLSVLTLGPLTNLALAVRLSEGAAAGAEGPAEPELPRLLARLVVMGGAWTGHGNVTPAAEFNVLEDPEAAAAVFQCAWPHGGLELVSWELTRASGASPACVGRWLRAGGSSPRAAFLERVSKYLLEKTESFNPAAFAALGFFAPDPLAAAVAVAPGIVAEAETKGVLVEVAGRWGRGQTIVDWNGAHPDLAPPCVRIIKRVAQPAFEALLVDSVATAGGGGGGGGGAAALP
jgi:purine nucleosidase